MTDHPTNCDVVLGASGFVGRHVAAALTRAGRSVVLVARDPSRIEALRGQYGLEGPAFALDVTDAAARRELWQRLKPRRIFNMVGYGVDRSERDPELYTSLNAELPRALVKELAAWGTPELPGWGLLHVGSALEYGRAPTVHEDDEPEPFEPYGRSKLAGTQGALDEAKIQGVPCVVARLFTVYGPGEHDTRLLPSLLAARQQSTPVELSSGEQKRDFTEVQEVAQVLMELSVSLKSKEIVNVATGELSTVRSFVEIAAQVLEINAERLNFGALTTRPDEMQHAAVPTERLQERLGHGLRLGIADGVRRTLDFFEGDLS